MFTKTNSRAAARLGLLGLALQACTPETPKANVPDGSITGVKIANEVVLSEHIKDGTIATADIKDAAVTSAKLASGVAVVGTTSSWSGAVTMASTLGLTGAATFANSLTVGSTLGVTGAVTHSSTTTLTGATTSAETITINKIDATNYATAVGKFGLMSTMRAENTAASTELYYGAFNESVAATAFTSAQMVGTHGQVRIPAGAAGAIVTTGIGVNSELNFGAAGTISNGYAFHGKVTLGAGPGVITSYRGLFLEDPGGGFTVNRYGIYSDGLIYNYFAGRVGIGQASPTVPLDVTGDARITGANLTLSGVAQNGGAGGYLCIDVAGAGLVTKNNAGTCLASDRRLKDEIKPIDNALEKVLKLVGVTFGWKDKKAHSNDRSIGLIAQDVKEVFPEAVQQNSRGFFSVNYEGLVGAVAAAVKELHGKWLTDHNKLEQQAFVIGQLEKKIELENIALKMENKALKDRLDKIEHALALASPDKSLKPAAKRKLASVK